MNLTFLLIAFSLIWLALALFLWRMAKKLRSAQQELDRLQEQK